MWKRHTSIAGTKKQDANTSNSSIDIIATNVKKIIKHPSQKQQLLVGERIFIENIKAGGYPRSFIFSAQERPLLEASS